MKILSITTAGSGRSISTAPPMASRNGLDIDAFDIVGGISTFRHSGNTNPRVWRKRE